MKGHLLSGLVVLIFAVSWVAAEATSITPNFSSDLSLSCDEALDYAIVGTALEVISKLLLKEVVSDKGKEFVMYLNDISKKTLLYVKEHKPTDGCIEN